MPNTRRDKPLPTLRMADVEPLLMPLIELRYDQCKWPYGDRGTYRFCGLTTMASSMPYCGPHSAIAYDPRVPKGLTMPSSLAA
jgi:hypothetical protein